MHITILFNVFISNLKGIEGIEAVFNKLTNVRRVGMYQRGEKGVYNKHIVEPRI
jgi:hypothetical protein